MRVIAAARSATRAQTDMAVRQLVPRSASGGAGYWAGSRGGGERDGRAAPSAPPWQARRGAADLSAGARGIDPAPPPLASAVGGATASPFHAGRPQAHERQHRRTTACCPHRHRPYRAGASPPRHRQEQEPIAVTPEAAPPARPTPTPRSVRKPPSEDHPPTSGPRARARRTRPSQTSKAAPLIQRPPPPRGSP